MLHLIKKQMLFFFTELEDQFLKGEVGKSSIKLDFEYYILYSQFLQNR